MGTVLPKGEKLRKAVQFVSDERQASPDKPLATIVGEATLRFDLSPQQGDYLVSFVRGQEPRADDSDAAE